MVVAGLASIGMPLRRIEDRKPGQGIPDDRLPPKLRAWKGAIEKLPYYEKTIPPHWKK